MRFGYWFTSSWSMEDLHLRVSAPCRAHQKKGRQRLPLAAFPSLIAYCPVPDNVTVFDVAGAATFTFNVALFAPVVVGLKVTETSQVDPAAKVAPHVVVGENTTGFMPPITIPLIAIGAVPVLSTVTV